MVAPQLNTATPTVSRGFRRSTSRRRLAALVAVRVVLVVVLAALLLGADRGEPGLGRPNVPAEASWPVRAAFYYPWYPETEHWATRYAPTLGKYDSSDPHVLATHVAQARYAGLDAFIASYWGPDTPTAQRLPLLLDVAGRQGFQIAAYYEPESQPTPPSQAFLNQDFDSLYRLSAEPAWLKVEGKPVLFVYNIGREASCQAVKRLLSASQSRFYLSLKVFAGYRNCAAQPDAWHQYVPARRYDQQG